MMELSTEVHDLLQRFRNLSQRNDESRKSDLLNLSTSSCGESKSQSEDFLNVDDIQFDNDEVWLYGSNKTNSNSNTSINKWLYDEPMSSLSSPYQLQDFSSSQDSSNSNLKKVIDSRTFTRPKKKLSRPSLEKYREENISEEQTQSRSPSLQQSNNSCFDLTLTPLSSVTPQSSMTAMSSSLTPSNKPLHFDLSQPMTCSRIFDNIVKNAVDNDSFQNMSPPSLINSMCSSTFTNLMENSYIKNDPVLREIRDADYSHCIPSNLLDSDTLMLQSLTESFSSLNSDSAENFLKRTLPNLAMTSGGDNSTLKNDTMSESDDNYHSLSGSQVLLDDNYDEGFGDNSKNYDDNVGSINNNNNNNNTPKTSPNTTHLIDNNPSIENILTSTDSTKTDNNKPPNDSNLLQNQTYTGNHSVTDTFNGTFNARNAGNDTFNKSSEKFGGDGEKMDRMDSTFSKIESCHSISPAANGTFTRRPKRSERNKTVTVNANATFQMHDIDDDCYKLDSESVKIDCDSFKIDSDSFNNDTDSFKVNSDSFNVNADSFKVNTRKSFNVDTDSCLKVNSDSLANTDGLKVHSDSFKIDSDRVKVNSDNNKIITDGSVIVNNESYKLDTDTSFKLDSDTSFKPDTDKTFNLDTDNSYKLIDDNRSFKHKLDTDDDRSFKLDTDNSYYNLESDNFKKDELECSTVGIDVGDVAVTESQLSMTTTIFNGTFKRDNKRISSVLENQQQQQQQLNGSATITRKRPTGVIRYTGLGSGDSLDRMSQYSSASEGGSKESLLTGGGAATTSSSSVTGSGHMMTMADVDALVEQQEQSLLIMSTPKPARSLTKLTTPTISPINTLTDHFLRRRENLSDSELSEEYNTVRSNLRSKRLSMHLDQANHTLLLDDDDENNRHVTSSPRKLDRTFKSMSSLKQPTTGYNSIGGRLSLASGVSNNSTFTRPRGDSNRVTKGTTVDSNRVAKATVDYNRVARETTIDYNRVTRKTVDYSRGATVTATGATVTNTMRRTPIGSSTNTINTNTITRPTSNLKTMGSQLKASYTSLRPPSFANLPNIPPTKSESADAIGGRRMGSVRDLTMTRPSYSGANLSEQSSGRQQYYSSSGAISSATSVPVTTTGVAKQLPRGSGLPRPVTTGIPRPTSKIPAPKSHRPSTTKPITTMYYSTKSQR